MPMQQHFKEGSGVTRLLWTYWSYNPLLHFFFYSRRKWLSATDWLTSLKITLSPSCSWPSGQISSSSTSHYFSFFPFCLLNVCLVFIVLRKKNVEKLFCSLSPNINVKFLNILNIVLQFLSRSGVDLRRDVRGMLSSLIDNLKKVHPHF